MTVCKGLIPDEVCGLFLFPASCPVLLHTVSFKRDFFCFLPVSCTFAHRLFQKGLFSVSCQLSCTFAHSLFQKGLFLFPANCPVLSHTTVSCQLSCTFAHSLFQNGLLFMHTFSHKMISDQTCILAVLTVIVIIDLFCMVLLEQTHRTLHVFWCMLGSFNVSIICQFLAWITN